MISKSAKADIEDMWDAGLRPSFDDIIRLNALALRVERAKGGFALNTLQRVAFLGEVAFREPTIGADIWLDEAARLFDAGQAETFMVLRAVSLCMPFDALPDAADEAAVLKCVEEMRERLGFATMRQIAAAIGYAVHGFSPDYGEDPVPAKGGEDEIPGEDVSFAVGVLHHGMALRLGSVADLKSLSVRVLDEMIMRAISVSSGENARKYSASAAEDDYLRTFDAIKARLEMERSDGE